ncbi:MAG: UvrB domain 3-containing protein [Microcystaceae cyanobacterium]
MIRGSRLRFHSKNDPDFVRTEDYAVNIQRIYFLDEVHRSYNPKGSFLANLNQSDRQAVQIGLTGTPLLGNEYNSKMLFGDYIHKYYYNASIADGYTLRLIREEISTTYKLVLQEALAKIEVLKGELKAKELLCDRRYVETLLDYILADFAESRYRFQDDSIGGMVICQSSEQARELYGVFQERLAAQNDTVTTSEIIPGYPAKTAALILHDIGTDKERKHWIEEFKEGRIDILLVYNMLLTGFDAKRLKKLYLGRVIRQHNLLQALTRVNRPYKNFRYGFVVDFADIRQRLLEWGKLSQTERKICEVLTAVKENADNLVSQNTRILNAEEYFNREMTRLLISQFKLHNIKLNAETSRYINHLVVKEYLNEFNGLG